MSQAGLRPWGRLQNEYQESSGGIKATGASGWQPHCHQWTGCLGNVRALVCTTLCASRPCYRDGFTLFFKLGLRFRMFWIKSCSITCYTVHKVLNHYWSRITSAGDNKCDATVPRSLRVLAAVADAADSQPQCVPLLEIVAASCGNQVSRAGSRRAKWVKTGKQRTAMTYTYNYVALFPPQLDCFLC
jgi:hypothetical protein